MEAALGFHHCTNMGAEFEFQPRGLIGGGVFRGMSFYRFCECECVCVCFQTFISFAIGFEFKYIHFILCYVICVSCIIYYKIKKFVFKRKWIWDREFWWFFCIQVLVCRSKNMIGVNLTHCEHLPLLWFYMHL